MVKLPCHTTEEDGTESNDARTCQEEPVQFIPDVWFDLRFWTAVRRFDQSIDGLFYLRNLYARVDDHADIVKAQADDLDGVFRAQRIVDQDQLVQETENEEGEVCGYRVRGAGTPGVWQKVYFKLGKDVALDGERNDGLGDGDERKGPGPARIRQPHHAPPAAALVTIPL